MQVDRNKVFVTRSDLGMRTGYILRKSRLPIIGRHLVAVLAPNGKDIELAQVRSRHMCLRFSTCQSFDDRVLSYKRSIETVWNLKNSHLMERLKIY